MLNKQLLMKFRVDMTLLMLQTRQMDQICPMSLMPQREKETQHRPNSTLRMVRSKVSKTPTTKRYLRRKTKEITKKSLMLKHYSGEHQRKEEKVKMAMLHQLRVHMKVLERLRKNSAMLMFYCQRPKKLFMITRIHQRFQTLFRLLEMLKTMSTPDRTT
jgi:hypothetical protein